MIRLLTFSLADRSNTNAQNLTVQEIAARLDPRRFELTLFSVSGDVADRCRRENVRIIRLPRRGAALRMALEGIRRRYDINFYVRLDPVQGLYQRLCAVFRRRIPRILHATYALDERMPPSLFDLWRRRIAASDVVVSNCEAVRRSLIRRLDLDTRVIYNGVDTALFRPRSEARRATGSVQVLTVGSLQERKRPEVVLEAARRLPEMNFTIIGQGELAEPSRARIAAEGLSNVRLVEPVPQGELAEMMKSFDVFLFPSLGEGHPQVVGQAAACALPVVAREQIEAAYIRHGETGYAVATDDELFECLAELGDSSELRHRLGSSGRSHMKTGFAWEPIVGQWQSTIEAASRAG